MNKNLPREIWDMIDVERRKAFRRRIVEFSGIFNYNVVWKVIIGYRSFWSRETYHSPSTYHYSTYSMSNVKYYHSYTHENRSGLRRGPEIVIRLYLIISFKYDGISHYDFIKRGVLGHEVIRYDHSSFNE